MAEQVKVADLATLERVRVALIHAAEAFDLALQEVDSEVQRAQDWLAEDRPTELQRLVRKAQDDMVRCKLALLNKQTIKATAESRPSVVDERKALDRATARLERLEAKLRATQRWNRELPTQRAVYVSGTRPLRTVADRDVPRACETLRRMGDHLDEYLRGGEEHRRVLQLLFGEALPAAPSEQGPPEESA